MQNRQTILQELQEITPAVATISNRNVYSVPPGYFDGLAGEVLAMIHMESLPVSMPYSVPQGYFNSFADTVMQKILMQSNPAEHSETYQELEEIAPLLNTINKGNIYSVPENYFKQFSVNINISQPQVKAKVVSINRNKAKWITYLAAACVTGILAIGAFWFKNSTQTQPPPVNVEKGIAGLSDDEINNYLNEHPSSGTEVTPAVIEQEVPDVQPIIKNLSTEEIQQYLDENSNPGEKSLKDI